MSRTGSQVKDPQNMREKNRQRKVAEYERENKETSLNRQNGV